MQANGNFHHHIPGSIFREANGIFDDADALDRTDEMFNADASVGQTGIVLPLVVRHVSTPWFFMGLHDADPVKRKAKKA